MAKDGGAERQTVGGMELDRWRSANKSQSDSWKRLIQPTISAHLKLASEMRRNGPRQCFVCVMIFQKNQKTKKPKNQGKKNLSTYVLCKILKIALDFSNSQAVKMRK